MERPGYFRRCHVCGAVTHVNEHKHIPECAHCGKPWAPFQYFDDRLTPILSDKTLRPQMMNGEWLPIQGLTVYWESF